MKESERFLDDVEYPSRESYHDTDLRLSRAVCGTVLDAFDVDGYYAPRLGNFHPEVMLCKPYEVLKLVAQFPTSRSSSAPSILRPPRNIEISSGREYLKRELAQREKAQRFVKKPIRKIKGAIPLHNKKLCSIM